MGHDCVVAHAAVYVPAHYRYSSVADSLPAKPSLLQAPPHNVFCIHSASRQHDMTVAYLWPTATPLLGQHHDKGAVCLFTRPPGHLSQFPTWVSSSHPSRCRFLNQSSSRSQHREASVSDSGCFTVLLRASLWNRTLTHTLALLL